MEEVSPFITKESTNETDNDTKESPYMRYIFYGIVIVLVIMVLVMLFNTYLRIIPGTDSFIQPTVKTGPEMDYDLNDEITKVKQIQENALNKLI